MNISEIRFTAKASGLRDSCAGCIFNSEPSAACRSASEQAAAHGLPDCDDAPGYIYVADDSDPRQMTIAEVVG